MVEAKAGIVLFVNKGTIPKATVARLPLYLHALERLMSDGIPTVSSEGLAALVRVNAAKVRKDLSSLGTYGVRGVGYEIESLQRQIRQALGLTRSFPVVVMGVGNLGSALADYYGFGEAGFFVVGLYDTDPDKIGQHIGDLEIRHPRRLAADVAEHQVEIGIVTTPAEVAQEAAEQLAACGVKSILNFAPTVLQMDSINIRRVDLATELQILSYYLQANRTAS